MAKIKKLLTFDDLVNFCETSHLKSFSFKDSGYRLALQVPSTFEIDNSSNRDGLLDIKVKVMHIGKNRNQSYISEDAVKKAMSSIKNRPVLGYIHQLDDGSYDFYGHNIEIVENEDGDNEVEYLEYPVGNFTEDEPTLEYDPEHDKTYLVAHAVIYEEYSKAADIIREKQGTKNSCEIIINSFAYNAKERCVEIQDFYFSGSTLLGSDDAGNEILEGMEGSRADIVDFSEQNNSMFAHKPIDNPASENERKEDDRVLEELLKKYGKTVEDLTFDYSELSDEELKKKFEDEFDIDIDDDDDDVDDDSDDDDEEIEETTETTIEEEDDDDDDDDSDEDEDEDEDDEDDDLDNPDDEFSKNEEPKAEPDSSEKKCGGGRKRDVYEVRMDEIWGIIYQLTEQYRNPVDNADEYCIPTEVYETYFIMCDYNSDRHYKVSYSVDGDNVTIGENRVEVFPEWLTADQKTALDTLQSRFEEVSTDLQKYKDAEDKANKEAVLADEAYEQFADTEEFKTLHEKMDEFTLDELKEKAELAFAKCVKEAGSFSAHKKEPQKTSTRYAFLNPNNTVEHKNPYGNLFEE
jgi:hypothetical protein